LIEGAWIYRMQARVSRKLLSRLEELPQPVREVAWKVQLRLCKRYRRRGRQAQRGRDHAIAREMVGSIWAITRMVQPQSAIHGRACRRKGDRAEHTIDGCTRQEAVPR